MATKPIPPAIITAPPVRVLFLCVHNSARSQMAEGFARALAPPGVEVISAGSEPSTVHPLAIEVMREAGIDLGSQRSKRLDDVPWQTADTVVTLCGEAEAVCPAVAAPVRRVHWPLPDPAAAPEAERLAIFRDVRDEIRWRVASLWPRG
ncbi:MAG: arsenate reductase ArsC [Candidatus Eisenbacteria bacterium]|uniref:Arsenate reductase ArsC n=1 Tax=Eiseniibacteriota bacterium TaxID=2212470 RepID=A0A9D6L5H2_UNCEI|nr:arsenate reductase ArsC [Candidatus Eisenbacteria bacterium]MBI3540207.1 arsenate reductase ArsC [Candidatus Eisenbacteria bacterium]